MDILDIIILFIIFLLIAGILLFYFTRKTPLKKLNIEKSLPTDTEFSQGLTVEYDKQDESEPVPELPNDYGDNKLTILVRDPYWVHLYWNITEGLRNELQNKFGNWAGSYPVLRIYNAADPDNPIKLFDVGIDDTANQWYLNVPENTSLLVELVRVYPNGQAITVLRSNAVKTPRAFMSDVIDEEWLLVGDKQNKLYKRIGVGKGPSSPDFYNPQK